MERNQKTTTDYTDNTDKDNLMFCLSELSE